MTACYPVRTGCQVDFKLANQVTKRTPSSGTCLSRCTVRNNDPANQPWKGTNREPLSKIIAGSASKQRYPHPSVTCGIMHSPAVPVHVSCFRTSPSPAAPSQALSLAKSPPPAPFYRSHRAGAPATATAAVLPLLQRLPCLLYWAHHLSPLLLLKHCLVQQYLRLRLYCFYHLHPQPRSILC